MRIEGHEEDCNIVAVCVGLGSDYDGWIIPPNGLEDVSKFPVLTYELLRRGYKEAEIRKILGENFLRAFGEAEKHARQFGGTISGNGSRVRLTPDEKDRRPANP